MSQPLMGTVKDIEILKGEIRRQLNIGRAYATTGRELARRLDMPNDRAIRRAIFDLTADGLPVASSTSPPYGFYIVGTAKEAMDYRAALRGRIIGIAWHLKNFKLASRDIATPEQLKFIER